MTVDVYLAVVVEQKGFFGGHRMETMEYWMGYGLMAFGPGSHNLRSFQRKSMPKTLPQMN